MTNDDGIDSDGVVLLAERLCDMGHEVYVCAPAHNQSAMSHSITMRTPYFAEKLTIANRKATYYAVDGKPVDCVQFGLSALKLSPDLLISGFNNDKNLGSDPIYSGTVGAAVEGAFNNVKSWALSVYYGVRKQPTCDFTQPIDYILSHFDEMYQRTDADKAMNINIPTNLPIRGIKFCPLAKGIYDMSYTRDEQGNYILSGRPIEYEKAAEGTDIYYVMQGYVTVTPLRYDLTHEGKLEQLNHE